MSIKSLLLKGNQNPDLTEKIADALLFFPRIFMGRTIRVISKEDVTLIGRKIGSDGTKKAYFEDQRNKKQLTKNFYELIGSFDSVGISLFLYGSIGAIVLATMVVGAAILGSIAVVGLSASTAVGLGLKKISVMVNDRSKLHQTVLDRFLCVEGFYKSEKKLWQELKLNNNEIFKINEQIKTHREELNGILTELEMRKDWLGRCLKNVDVWNQQWLLRRLEAQKQGLVQRNESCRREFETLALQETALRASLRTAVRNYDAFIAKGTTITPTVDLTEVPTSLHMLLRTKSFDAAQRLIKDPLCDLNAKDKNGSAPLHEAIKAGQQEIIQSLLQNGASVNARDRSGKSPLEVALEMNNSASVGSLLKKEAIETVDQAGVPLLFLAIKLGQEKNIEQLLLHSPQYIEVKNETDMTPFLFAVWQGKTSLARILFQHKADFEAVTTKEKNTILHLAASSRNEEMLLQAIEWLKEKRSLNIEVKNNDGRTPLHLAVRTGNIGIIKKLLNFGANQRAVDRFGKMPVDYRPHSQHSPQISNQIKDLLIIT